MLPKKRIFSIDVSFGSYSSFIDTLLNLAEKRVSSYVCVANVHMLVEAYKSESFQEIVNGADIVTPDGMPLAKSFKSIYGVRQERVDGMTLLPQLLVEGYKRNLSVFFYGGSEKMIVLMRDYLSREFPDMTIAGLYSPPFRPLSDLEKEEVVNMISQSKANIVFVALGCPKQERWMAEMKGRIPALMIGIGGALPVLLGIQRRAPYWMQKFSLEWLFRLLQEPKRLFKRYLITNSVFLYLVARQKLRSISRTNEINS